jgi:hypothetical protein
MIKIATKGIKSEHQVFNCVPIKPKADTTLEHTGPDDSNLSLLRPLALAMEIAALFRGFFVRNFLKF